jgi:hypothetical protein
MKTMTTSELKSKILAIMPDASFDEKENGELVINTGLEVDNENLIRHWKFIPYEVMK